MAAYTTPTLIAQYLGLTVSSAWTAQATLDAQMVTDWIDRWLGKTWQGSSPLTETQRIYGDRFWVMRPISAITSLSVRDIGPQDTSTTLTEGEDFRVLDAASGEIGISGYLGYRATVVYTSGGVVPTPVAHAATAWAAHELFPTLHPEAQRLASLKDDLLTLTYRDEPDGLPPEVRRLLEPYRLPVVV